MRGPLSVGGGAAASRGRSCGEPLLEDVGDLSDDEIGSLGAKRIAPVGAGGTIDTDNEIEPRAAARNDADARRLERGSVPCVDAELRASSKERVRLGLNAEIVTADRLAVNTRI